MDLTASVIAEDNWSNMNLLELSELYPPNEKLSFEFSWVIAVVNFILDAVIVSEILVEPNDEVLRNPLWKAKHDFTLCSNNKNCNPTHNGDK